MSTSLYVMSPREAQAGAKIEQERVVRSWPRGSRAFELVEVVLSLEHRGARVTRSKVLLVHRDASGRRRWLERFGMQEARELAETIQRIVVTARTTRTAPEDDGG